MNTSDHIKNKCNPKEFSFAPEVEYFASLKKKIYIYIGMKWLSDKSLIVIQDKGSKLMDVGF